VVGYRDNSTSGIATGSQPEGMYMVASGTHFNSGCCFDYGNAETNNKDTGNGHMDAINFGTECWFSPCYGGGPWVQADLENGLFQSDSGYSKNTSNTGTGPMPFVTALLKNNGQNHFALKYGNAQSGSLTTTYSGGLPNGYSPMKTDSSLLLGTGGDNSVSGQGEFFEGAITAGFPTDATENAVQATITAAGYGTSGTGGGTATQLRNTNANRCLDVPNLSQTNGTQTALWDCNGGTNQMWTPTSAKELRVYDNKCLDASGSGTANGTKAIIWDCNGQTNQQWNVNSDGTITSVQSGLCLDAAGYGTANGTLVQLWQCTGATNQKWTKG
jgi:hypothetical protein